MGHADVDAMLASMSGTQFREWMAFYSIEPWGFDVEERRPAQVAAMIAAAHTGKGRPPPKVSDFMLDTRSEREKQLAAAKAASARAEIKRAQDEAAEIAATMTRKD